MSSLDNPDCTDTYQVWGHRRWGEDQRVLRPKVRKPSTKKTIFIKGAKKVNTRKFVWDVLHIE